MLNLLSLSKKNTMRITDTVYNSIKTAIVKHDLSPGAHLSVPALAEKLGVSRSPIREAVQKLIAEGLAFEKPRKGAFVTDFDVKDLLPLFQVRLVLDGLAAKIAAKEMTKSLHAKLERTISNHRTSIDKKDPDKYTNADIQFHMIILEASNNSPLKDLAKQIYDQIYVAMKTRVAPLGPEVTFKDHLNIFNALIKSDSAKAETAARSHVEHIIKQIIKISKAI